jgi:hypothetical protein
MIRYSCAIALSILIVQFALGQSIRVSGFVTDDHREALAGVSVRSADNEGVLTNQDGFFSLLVESPHSGIFLHYFGYESDTLYFAVLRDTQIHVALKNKMLSEVIISDNHRYDQTQISTVKLPLTLAKKMPNLGGESDIMKALAFTPGVTNGSEGSSGLFVRGGTPDQNLILLDNAVVYNPNHLFGFLSTFNADALKDVELMRGGFPARYGGRLSSVLNVTMKEGSRKKIQGEAGVGLLTSRFLLEGPIFQKRGSFIVSARSAYIGLVTLPKYIEYRSGANGDYTAYNMFDINAKINYDFSNARKLYLSFYTGKDALAIRSRTMNEDTKTRLHWGNITGTLRYTETINAALFWKHTIAYSQFDYNYDIYASMVDSTITKRNYFKNNSKLRSLSLKSEIDYVRNNQNFIKIGLEQTIYSFAPRSVSILNLEENPSVVIRSDNQNQASETILYAEHEWQPNAVWKINYGLRSTLFFNKKSYITLDPRVNVLYRLNASTTMKASYGMMNQNIHLLTNSALGYQNDIWVPSTGKIPNQRSHQGAIGMSYYAKKIKTTLTFDVYYKYMTNQLEYKEGVVIFDNNDTNWQDLVETNGIGRAYGMEIGLSKVIGNWTFLSAYTYAISNRTFPTINNGKTFAFKYDFRHNFNTTANLRLSKKWDVSSSMVYHSGQPFSMPITAVSMLDGFNQGAYMNPHLFYYKDRNNIRLPDYFRIDIGANKTKVKKNGRTVVWSFSVYNVLNRPNPLYAQIANESEYVPQTQQLRFKPTLRLKAFLPILPSIGYATKF